MSLALKIKQFTDGSSDAGKQSPLMHFKAASLLQQKLRHVRVRKHKNSKVSVETVLQQKIEREEKIRYDRRIQVLRGVKTFSEFSPEQLHRAALNMNEQHAAEGEIVIRQGDSGDEFFIIEKGVAIVSRKMRPDDPREEPQELVRLGEFAFFGEIALVTNERRSATITAAKGGLQLLVMNKDEFEKHLQKKEDVSQRSRNVRGKEVVASIPIFQMLSEKEREEMLEVMVPMQYKPSTYICAQGTPGNNFHIIVEGKCRVTVADEDHPGTERQVSILNRDDFFGEVSLLDKDNKRTANVISVTPVTTMALSRTNFHKFLKKVRPMLMEHQALRSLQQSLLSPKRSNRKSDSIFKHIAKTIVTNLRRSAYYRFAGALIRRPTGIQKYGHVVARVFLTNSDFATTRDSLKKAFKDTMLKDKISRSDSDVALIAGITRQNSRLKNEYMTSWPSYWYSDLCRVMVYQKYDAMTEIFENNSRGTKAYSILRGTVSLMQYHANEQGQMIRTHYKDCGPGDCFGEHALVGMSNRGYTAMALSDCELIEIEEKDFTAVMRNGRSVKSNNQKFDFLRAHVPIFQDWEYYRLFRLASLCQFESYSKDTVVIQKGLCAESLYIIMNGSVDIRLPEKTKAVKMERVAKDSNEEAAPHDEDGMPDTKTIIHERNPERRTGPLRVISGLHTADYFGETGVLTYGAHGKRVYTEHAYVVTASHCEFLVINTSAFKMIDRNTLEKIKSNYQLRASWRSSRWRESRVTDARIGDVAKISQWPKSYATQKAESNPLMAKVERHKVKQKVKSDADAAKRLKRPKSANVDHSSNSTSFHVTSSRQQLRNGARNRQKRPKSANIIRSSNSASFLGSSVQTAIPAEAPVALQTQHNFRVRGNDISYISKHHLDNFFCAFRFASFASIIVRNRMMVLLESPFFFTLSEISPTCQNQGTGFELTLQEDP